MKNLKSIGAGISLLMIVFMIMPSVLMAADGSKLAWGFRERLRNTYMNNNSDFNADNDDEEDFFRVRTNVWGRYSFTPNLAIQMQVTNEFRYYTMTPKVGEFTWDEIFIDNLFLHWSSGGKNPVSMTLGRQNLIYGEGFILLEGGPWDGSRAIFHDAIKISVKNGNTTYDFLGISNPTQEYRLPAIRAGNLGEVDNLGLPVRTKGLPKTRGGKAWLNDGTENALGVYVTQKFEAGSQLESYFISKIEDPRPFIPVGDVNTDRLTLNTMGARVIRPLSPKLTLITEWAAQLGMQKNIGHRALGGYAYVNYKVHEKTKGVLSGGFNYLSGDDPSTADNEGWNPIFSRWPKWSELYIYSQIGETIRDARRVAYWTNTFSPYLKYSLNVSKNIGLTATVYHLRALHSRMLGDVESGTTRGNEFQLLLKYKFLKKFTGHLLYDFFMPGDFYAEPQSNAMFFRAELMYTL